MYTFNVLVFTQFFSGLTCLIWGPPICVEHIDQTVWPQTCRQFFHCRLSFMSFLLYSRCCRVMSFKKILWETISKLWWETREWIYNEQCAIYDHMSYSFNRDWSAFTNTNRDILFFSFLGAVFCWESCSRNECLFFVTSLSNCSCVFCFQRLIFCFFLNSNVQIRKKYPVLIF